MPMRGRQNIRYTPHMHGGNASNGAECPLDAVHPHMHGAYTQVIQQAGKQLRNTPPFAWGIRIQGTIR